MSHSNVGRSLAIAPDAPLAITQLSSLLFLTLLLAALPPTLRAQAALPATEEKPSEAKSTSTPKPAPDKAVAMPEMKILGRKPLQQGDTAFEAKKRGVDMDKQIAREKKNTQPTDTDSALNNSKFSVMGAYSAEARANDAKGRIAELKVKQTVAAVSEDPEHEEENKKLLKLLDELEYAKKHR